MSRWFHVTSSLNRVSIQQHGLDWRWTTRPGIAGSATPEVEGVYVCDEQMVDFFVRFTTADAPVDVWAIDGIDDDELLDSAEGFQFVARAIPAGAVSLHAPDLLPPERPVDEAAGAYSSTLTVALEDGTVLRDDDVAR